MNQLELLGELREIVGAPGLNDVSNRQLLSHVIPALEWLAVKLKYHVVEEDHGLLLVAGQQEYPLPPNLVTLIWAEWNGNRLAPSSTYRWDREGLVWRTMTAANPNEIAVQGRSLIFAPPPSATAIATEGAVKLRFLASAAGSDATGTPGLSTFEQQLVLYKAAIRYLRVHPSDENTARAAACAEELAEILPDARRARENTIADFYPNFHVHTMRRGGAR